MKLTAENKAHIDGLSYHSLLEHWRNAPVGDPWFEGETGEYWAKVMSDRRNQPGGNEVHVNASKSIGFKESGQPPKQ